jgi:putative transposase
VYRISRIQELLKQIPRGQFDRLVSQHQADKYTKRFRTWDQLTAMVYAQLSGAQGLRQLEAGFNAQRTHHYHLGTRELRRSTLAEANAKRSPRLFAEVAHGLMARAHRSVRRSCQELLYALDSTSVTLKGRGFDSWTADTRTSRTQGVKLHILYEARAQVPCWQSITAPNVNDRDEGVRLQIEPGALYVFDKGYCDYNWWQHIDARGARFVTRFKRNAALTSVRERAVPKEAQDSVLRDQLVRFSSKYPGGGRRNRYDQPLRRLEIARDNDTPLVLATNDLDSPAADIAQHYKDRWQVELFFKWIKQHLNIKRFLGDSENAVKIQILTALIAYLLLVLHRQAHGLGASLWSLLGELRATLFQRPGVEVAAYHRRRRRLSEFAALQPGLF